MPADDDLNINVYTSQVIVLLQEFMKGKKTLSALDFDLEQHLSNSQIMEIYEDLLNSEKINEYEYNDLKSKRGSSK